MDDKLLNVVEASKNMCKVYTEACEAAEIFVKQFSDALKELAKDEEFMFMLAYLKSEEEE